MKRFFFALFALCEVCLTEAVVADNDLIADIMSAETSYSEIYENVQQRKGVKYDAYKSSVDKIVGVMIKIRGVIKGGTSSVNGANDMLICSYEIFFRELSKLSGVGSIGQELYSKVTEKKELLKWQKAFHNAVEKLKESEDIESLLDCRIESLLQDPQVN
jgi:hypothetical protein